MPKTHWFISLIACLNISAITATGVNAQAILPYTLDLSSDRLEEQGQELIEDAIQLVRFQQYELAIPYAKLSTQLAPYNYEAWFILGTLLIQDDSIDEAIIALQRAYLLNREESGISLSLGSAFFRKGDYELAVERLEEGIALDEENISGLFDLGNAYYMLKRYQDAINSYEKAIEIDEEFWPGINNIGLIYYEQGNTQKALEYWRKAVAIDNSASEPQLAVAVALYTQGQETQGFMKAEEALTLDSRYANLDFLKENLWGDRLLEDTKTFFETLQMKALLEELPIPDLEF